MTGESLNPTIDESEYQVAVLIFAAAALELAHKQQAESGTMEVDVVD